tara:strand:+ start:407 stop:3130 length:2724 start_codon:yes stop_codon:yes gene_type:complete
MAGITSYSSGTLKLSDYLIGTDVSTENVTRSMPVSDIVASILAAKSIGTVTSISTSNSTFVNLAGGPITITGSLTSSLSATGTPSAGNYLRGDNTWAEPGPTPTDIISQNSGNTLTTDTAKWDFTGTGVTASSINDNVQVEILGLLSSVDSVLNGVAITATGSITSNPSTGDVTVTNSGVYQARAGGNITLSGSATPLQYSSAVTVNTTSNAGTITNVNPGQGTEITNASTNAEIDIDYAGLDSFILANADTASSDDIIAFQDLSASEVKTAKLNTVPTSALTTVKTTIDNADTGKVKNIDTFNTVWKAKEMVTLTISEYNAICPGVSCDANTLYLIVGPGTAYTATLNPTYNVTGGALGVGYTTTVEVNDGTGWVASSSLTAVAGTTYEFRITLTLINGYTLSSGSLTASTGTLTMPSSNTTDNLSITAVIAPPPTPQCTVTLNIIDSTSGIGAGQYTISGNQTNDTVTVDQGAQYTFSSTATANSGYYFSPSPSYSGFTGTAPSQASFTADAYISGTILQTTYDATLTVTQGNTLAVSGTGGTLSGSGISYSYQSNTPNTSYGQTITGLVNGNAFSWNQPGVSVNANYDASAVTFSTDAAGSSAATFPYGGTMATSNQSLTIYSQGTIVYTAPPSVNFVTMNWTGLSNITDNTSAGYNLSPPAYISGGPGTAGDSGNASIGSSGWTISPGTASITMVSTGQYISSGGTPGLASGPDINGSASMPASPLPAPSTWDVPATTIDWKTVILKIDWELSGNQYQNGKGAIYNVEFFSGSTSIGTKTITGPTTIGATSSSVDGVGIGSGAPSIIAVNMTGGTTIKCVVSRTHDAWYSSANTWPACGPGFSCSGSVPASTTGYVKLQLNSGYQNVMTQWYSAGSTSVTGAQYTVYPSANTGDIVTCYIRES